MKSQRSQGSPWPSSHRRRSSDSASSCTLFNHSWIGLSQLFQKETRRTYHMLMLHFTFVSTSSGSRLRGTNSNAGNSFRFPTLVKSCARSACINIERRRHRHRREANLSQPHHTPEFKPRPLRLGMHSTLSGAFLVLPRWMERQGCGHALHLWDLSQLHLSTPAEI